MATRDLVNGVGVDNSIAPVGNRNASVNGASADLRGFDSAMATFVAGTITDGTHTPKLQDSPDNSAWTDVAAADQQGTLVAITASSLQKVGYIGDKRFLRAVVTVSGATTGGQYHSDITKSHAHQSPVA